MKKEALTIMDLQRMSPKSKKGNVTRNEIEAFAKVQELKAQFQISQSILHMLSDIETCQELLKVVVINKIEKELEVFKATPSLKERQKRLEGFINEYISNFDTLRKVFSNSKYDQFIEKDLMNLVSQESLEDIEKSKLKKVSVDMHAKELLLRQYELIRNDISSRLAMLEALNAMDRLIEDSEAKIEQYNKEKIEYSTKVKEYNQEIVAAPHSVRHEQQAQTPRRRRRPDAHENLRLQPETREEGPRVPVQREKTALVELDGHRRGRNPKTPPEATDRALQNGLRKDRVREGEPGEPPPEENQAQKQAGRRVHVSPQESDDDTVTPHDPATSSRPCCRRWCRRSSWACFCYRTTSGGTFKSKKKTS